MYDRWQRHPAPGYVMFRARTQDNAEHLPASYIENLRATYPANLLQAYLDGEFVNLAAGSVYPEFDRGLSGCSDSVYDGETVHVGMDFNVTKMAAVVFVLRDGKPRAVAEHTGIFDTPAMIDVLRKRYSRVMVYPDASGGGRKSVNASVSDLQLLRQAGFTVCARNTNPAVKDRVLAVNKLIRDRALGVNVDNCPEFVESLEKQCYDKNGEPDKSSGLDHVLDAAGYFLAYKFPIVRPALTLKMGWAH